MTIKKLIKELCKREGLKKQVDIAQVTEIVGHLAEIVFEECEVSPGSIKVLEELVMLGQKRAKKKEKKNAKR